ncbi:riboflavin biosynthesis protein RibD domain-containing protein [Tricharina praecox]|uniref:riboflavin biosynthesis protein RibD domain-containing protein n=1 Tax=Tricharina praecox TaxID=43433 RepID=UPI002220ECDD|nr:riboflavin biosynthesis protein RibD domain-containing protein [Tricharina praecox]KAI5848196.1 riboflavin biosynthesis protein RibD domain-containing protein [Tricharina praecox]
MTTKMSTLPPLPPSIPAFLSAYLPPSSSSATPTPSPSPVPLPTRPFVTLTYATSLDSHLSLSAGVQTLLSGSATKALTHYLRTQHSAILIGASTAIADDPGLNSRLPGTPLARQPRPVVLDPQFRWRIARDARVLRTAGRGEGKAPFVFVSAAAGGEVEADERVRLLEEAGGRVVRIDAPPPWSWKTVLETIAALGLDSVMVEGGGKVINGLLRRENRGFVDSVVVTVAPVYLGTGGVNVCPPRVVETQAAVRFTDVLWTVLGNDVVMAARPDLS